MRQSISLCPPFESATDTSHSSLAQASAHHQSPEALHGPAARIILPRTVHDEFIPRALISVGRPPIVLTSARHACRNTLNAIIGSADVLSALSPKRDPSSTFFLVLRFSRNLVMRNASGLCVSKSS